MLAERLFNLESFQRQYQSIVELSVCSSIENLVWNREKQQILSEIHWDNVLSIASILAQSSISEHMEAALRIAQTCLEQDCTEGQKGAAVFILERLSNHRAFLLAVSRCLASEKIINDLPIAIKFEINRLKISNSVEINNKIILLNKFQKDVFLKADKNSALSISAPTSSGKSFVLYQLLLSRIKDYQNIIYIVPTRSLVDQVENDLNQLVDEYDLKEVLVCSVPRIQDSLHTVYVLTQERLHKLYVDQPSFKCEFIIIDEAHKIEDGYRGILLERKIEDIVKSNPNVEIVFSSPFTSNPEKLLTLINKRLNTDVVNTEFIAVNQNLIYISQQPRKSLQWNLDLIFNNYPIHLGHILLPLSQRPTSESKKVAYLTVAIGSRSGGNLIYANGAYEAEKYGELISQLVMVEQKNKQNSQLKDFIKLVKKNIHRDYILSKILNREVSIHYGNLPLNIRQEIENLFKLNIIKYLVCTSTLLEGVNLPAKNIFIRKPKRGSKTPLNTTDFWNLAGRAGRWGKEFSGNIFCIEPREWEIKPDLNKKKQTIKLAIEGVYKNNKNLLIEYISDIECKQKRNPLYEFAWNYYYMLFKQNNIPATSEEEEIFEAISKSESSITLPLYIIERNPGISPIVLQNIFEYFKSYTKEVENLIPVYPEDNNSKESYFRLVNRIENIITGETNNKRAAYQSSLVLNWMKGRPLALLIQDSINYYKRVNSKKSIDTICREVMEEIENFVRFRFVKDTSCYIDILKYYLNQIDRKDLIDTIPDLAMWLEFGVCEETQITLLTLGFSRQAAIDITDLIPNSNYGKTECIEWLLEFDEINSNLSNSVQEEIKLIRKRISQSNSRKNDC